MRISAPVFYNPSAQSTALTPEPSPETDPRSPQFGGKRRPKAWQISTPDQLSLSIRPTADNAGSEVTLQAPPGMAPTHMRSRWQYWHPHPDTPLGTSRLYWTRNYIGTDEAFYKAGYRWGVSLGGSLDAFKHSALYLPGNRINLPNGKYLIAIRQDDQARKELVIGKEDRGSDQRVLEAFHQGKAPETNQRNELLGVSNHSMLISRGQPYNPETSNPFEFSAAFGGEAEVFANRIRVINDQTGQLFGPNGLVKPPSEATKEEDRTIKQPDIDLDKAAALKDAKDTLEAMELNGGDPIRTVKVEFFNDAPAPKDLKAPRTLTLPGISSTRLQQYLSEPRIQGMLDELAHDPKMQDRLIGGLAQNGDYRFAVLDLRNRLITQGNLKPLQATQLAVELLESPEALGLFETQSPYFLAGLTDNTKRKLLAAYNRISPKKRPQPRQLIQSLKHHPEVLRFLMGQRVPGPAMRQVVGDVEAASQVAGLVQSIFNTALSEAPLGPEELVQLEGTDPEMMGNVSTSGRRLKDIGEKVNKKGASAVMLFLQKNPFNGTGLSVDKLPDNLARIRHLQEQGVTVYCDPGFRNNKALTYLTNLYAFAHAPTTSQDAVIRQDIENLLGAYGVDAKDLHAFVREKFEKRWVNKQIVAAYAQQDKAFYRFLEDLGWILNQPLASY